MTRDESVPFASLWNDDGLFVCPVRREARVDGGT